MDKKGTKKRIVIDDKEDLEIKKIASLKDTTPKFLLYVLIVLFCIMLGCSVLFINYYVNSNENNNSIETIEVNSRKNKVLITNNGELDIDITYDSFKVGEDLVLEKISTIELATSKDAKEKGKIFFDVKYDVLENDFKRNEFSSLSSDVLVKFSYSFDNENWKYINNVISTDESTISPMMGNNYDISGIVSNLKIATNYELKSDIGEITKMYWRSEVVFKNKESKKINNNFKANFKIEYKDND